MAEINWTKESQRWLKEIHDYISRDNPKAALSVVRGILAKVEVLKRMPEVGQRYDRYPQHNIRILLYGHYRIAYLLKERDVIYILGVFHGALDIERYLSN